LYCGLPRVDFVIVFLVGYDSAAGNYIGHLGDLLCILHHVRRGLYQANHAFHLVHRSSEIHATQAVVRSLCQVVVGLFHLQSIDEVHRSLPFGVASVAASGRIFDVG
jgi:hypothetical protein